MEYGIEGGTGFEDGENGEGEYVEEIIEEIIEDDEDPEKALLYETVEQTAERSKKEAQEASKSPDGKDELTGTEAKSKSAEKLVKGQDKQQDASEPTQQLGPIEPPQRFTAEAKAAWAKAPRVLQEQYKKTIDDLQVGQQNKLREIHEVRQAAETVLSGVQPWVKDWAKRGITAPQGVALLAETHAQMVENPAKKLAELAIDNGVSVEQINAYITGEGIEGEGGTGFSQDITRHPQFKALTSRLEQLENEKRQEAVRTETDKIRALRDEVDSSGNKPFGRILDPEFLTYAQPLVNALRTPPRGEDGKFISGPPLSITDAYKKAYYTWLSENGLSSQIQATGNQPRLNTQPQQERQLSQPISMRPRSVPVGRSPMSQNGDPNKYRYETVEETMARLRAQNWQGE